MGGGKHGEETHHIASFVDTVEATTETLTSRAGINLFVSYLHESHITLIFDHFFYFIRKSSNGLSITDLHIQKLCWFIDGTSRHLVYLINWPMIPGAQPQLGWKRIKWLHHIRSSVSQ